MAQLPETLDERLPPRLPSAQRLWIHVLHCQHWRLPLLAGCASSIRRAPPTFTGAHSALQRLCFRRPRLDILRSGVLAILAQTVGLGRSQRCQEARWTHYVGHSMRKSLGSRRYYPYRPE